MINQNNSIVKCVGKDFMIETSTSDMHSCTLERNHMFANTVAKLLLREPTSEDTLEGYI